MELFFSNNKRYIARLSDDIRFLLVQSESGERQLWDLQFALMRYSESKSPSYIHVFVVSPSVTWLALRRRDSVSLVDLNSGQQVSTIPFPRDMYITPLAISPDNKLLLVRENDTKDGVELAMYEVQSGAKVRVFDKVYRNSDIAFTPGGNVAAWERDSGLRVFSTAGELKLDIDTGKSHYLELKRDFGKVLAVVDGQLAGFDLDTCKKTVIPLPPVPSHLEKRSFEAGTTRFTRETVIVTPDTEGRTYIIGLNNFELRAVLDARADTASRDGLRFYSEETGSNGEHIYNIHDAATGAVLLNTQHEKLDYYMGMMRPDGRCLSESSYLHWLKNKCYFVEWESAESYTEIGTLAEGERAWPVIYPEQWRVAVGSDFTGKGDNEYRVFKRRRPPEWWGVFYLWEVWLSAALLGALVWSARR